MMSRQQGQRNAFPDTRRGVGEHRRSLWQAWCNFDDSNGWSQEELHVKSGLGRAFTGHIECGEMDVGTDTLYKLAKVFQMKLSELMEGIDDLTLRSK